MNGFAPFNVVDLKLIGKVIVYEQLPRQVHHTRAYQGDDDPDWSNHLNYILITKSVPTAILQVSRQVHEEAKGIVKKTITEFILNSTPKFVTIGPSIGKETLLVTLFNHFIMEESEHFLCTGS